MKRILIVFAGLILPLIALGDLLDKSSTFTLEKDADTGIWMAECNVKVDGVDSKGTYNGRHIYRSPTGASIEVIDWVVSPADRMYNESSPGVYEFQVKLTGKSLRIYSVYYEPVVYVNDGLQCTSHNYGGQPPPDQNSEPVHLVTMNIRVDGGEPTRP